MLRALAFLPLLMLAVVFSPSPVQAHGNLDQALEGDPGCNSTNFGASVTAASGQRQSFVPTGSQLISVALCVSAAQPNTPLIVAIYTQGGTLVGGGSTASNPSIPDAAGPPIRFVHVDFLQPYSVTPGATYVIENLSGVPITWYGTAAGSPYGYCLGAPNTSAVGDYGFQSFLVDSPAASAPCPEPPATSTPVPTNTPAAPTSTPVPGATTGPTNTPAPGATAASGATPPSGGIPAGASAPTSDSATNSGGAAGAGSAPSGLPGSGYGNADRANRSVSLPLLLSTCGILFIATGAALRLRAPSRRRRA